MEFQICDLFIVFMMQIQVLVEVKICEYQCIYALLSLIIQNCSIEELELQVYG
jgi:hypothetical protein